MSSDMKKRTFSGRLRLPAALLPAAGLGCDAFCAADGSAVASAALAAVVRKLRLLLVLFSRSLIVESALQVYTRAGHPWGARAAAGGRIHGRSCAGSGLYCGCGAVKPGVPPLLPGMA